MRASVMAAFTKFNTPLEGMLSYMYTEWTVRVLSTPAN